METVKGNHRVTFPDANLETAIRQAIDKPEGAISTSDLEKVIVITASGRNISNLSGLEYCVNLQRLHLSFNNISDISPLAGLTNLEWLSLGGNNIKDISALAGLSDLQGLYLWPNNISDISVLASLTSLEYLDTTHIG